jgi:ppGpp synthetase/RelA/SpoT-type nucleotidyltranferase
MIESEFSDKWENEKPIYEEWGNYVVSKITNSLSEKTYDIKQFLKQPCEVRLKDDASLLDKAFYRKGKGYTDPYEQIEDKVGCRFVVLLVEDIKVITDIVETAPEWEAYQCRNFGEERDASPLLFTYQSVHYIVKPREKLSLNGIKISKNIPCEIQIRTLLQHAYAELTHNAVYKTKTSVKPIVHRTVAKSMALIETTDDFFSAVHRELNSTPLEQLNFQSSLDSLYLSLTGLQPTPAQKSSLTILDEFSDVLKEDLIAQIESLFRRYDDFIELLVKERELYPWFSQSIVMFIMWLIKKEKHMALDNWPIDRRILEIIASDMGESLDIH